MKKQITVFAGLLVACFLGMQLDHPPIPSTASTHEIEAPPEVKAVLRKDCYSCHSNEVQLSWFDQLQPGYVLVRQDILDARSHLNFSTLGEKPAAAQKALLYEAATMMQLGAMPLPRFTALHPAARVTKEDLDTLEKYLAPWNNPVPHETSEATKPQASTNLEEHVAGSPNGLPYDGGWHHWKLLAVTDRGDNHQFRMILGNEIAVRAAKQGAIHPWPDGARLAKPAWLQVQDDQGIVLPAQFWQVELMVKEHTTFKSNGGWNWGRWRGDSLKPYGKDASVVRECTSCHLPVKDNDFVYTQPFSDAATEGREVLNPESVHWPAGLHFDPLTWAPVTLFSDPARGEISVLFAEEETNAAPGSPLHGSLALVTWKERDDPHWFGARMAGKVASVETLHVENGALGRYQYFAGSLQSKPPVNSSLRAAWIAALHAPSKR